MLSIRFFWNLLSPATLELFIIVLCTWIPWSEICQLLKQLQECNATLFIIIIHGTLWRDNGLPYASAENRIGEAWHSQNYYICIRSFQKSNVFHAPFAATQEGKKGTLSKSPCEQFPKVQGHKWLVAQNLLQIPSPNKPVHFFLSYSFTVLPLLLMP